MKRTWFHDECLAIGRTAILFDRSAAQRNTLVCKSELKLQMPLAPRPDDEVFDAETLTDGEILVL